MMANIQRLTRKKLGTILLEAGIIDDIQLQAALTEQAETHEVLGEILVRHGFCSEHDIVTVVASQFSLPFLAAEQIDLVPQMATLLPPAFLRKHLIAPLDRFGTCLSLLTAGLLTAEVVAQIEQRTGCDVQLFIGTISDVKELLTQMAEADPSRQPESARPAAAAPAAKSSASH